MSSMIFQPLLHDPLGWKPAKSTYVDHYKWKKYRTTSKDRKISTYGQRYQREQHKQLPLKSINNEQVIDRVVLVKKRETQSVPTHRCTPLKTPVVIVEHQQRPISATEETTSNVKLRPRPPTAPPAVMQEKPAGSPSKERTLTDLNNDNSRHWLTYPNPRTPQYIIDIKQRLGQLRISSTLSGASSSLNQEKPQPSTSNIRPLSASNQDKQPSTFNTRPLSASNQDKQSKVVIDNDHHFLSIATRQTPDELRAARYRLDKHRYHPSLDNYPARPQTCPIRTNDTPKLIAPEEISTVKTDVWMPIDDENKTFLSDNDTGSFLIQTVDCDGLPTEYVEALETSNLAQEEYLKNLDKRHETLLYHSSENTNDSLNAYQNQLTTTIDMNSQLRHVVRTTPNDFGSWVRNATDKERASAMKLLTDVLNKPIIEYENGSKTRINFKHAPVPPPIRTTSATRKLGRTRTQHKFPCEVCEKLLIKRHVWDLNGSETLTCPHHPQGIQVQT